MGKGVYLIFKIKTSLYWTRTFLYNETHLLFYKCFTAAISCKNSKISAIKWLYTYFYKLFKLLYRMIDALQIRSIDRCKILTILWSEKKTL